MTETTTTTYEVRIERVADGKRFARFFAATSEQGALLQAYQSIRGEHADYYVISVTRI